MHFRSTAYLLLICCSHFSKCENIQTQFITDFFKENSNTITAHVCWTYARIKAFVQSSIKQIAVYNNSIDYFPFFYHKSLNNYFVIDFNNCNKSWQLIEHANTSNLFRFPLKYLFLISQHDFDNRLQNILSNYSIYPVSDVIVAKRVENTYELSLPYRLKSGNEDLIWESYATWNEVQGLRVNQLLPVAERRKNLKHARIIIILHMDTEETWKHLEDFKLPRVDTFTKQNFGTIKALTEYCNFDPVLTRINDYGYFNKETREWSGMVRKIQDHEVDLAGSSLYYTPQRFTVVDFIKMQNPLQIRFLLKKPPLSYVSNIYTLPFERNVWITFAILVCLFFITMYLTLNWEVVVFKEHGKSLYSPVDIIVIVLECICQQGTVSESKKIPGRILQFMMFLGFFFFYTSFSAFIIVILQSTVTITSWQQLLDSDIKVGGMNTSYMAIYLSGSRNPVHQQIYQKKIGPKGYYPLEVGMAKVQAGFFALHTEVAGGYDYILEKFTDYEICGYQELEGFTEYYKGYTMVPKNSPYKEIFKVGLLKLEEYGIQRRNNMRFLRKPQCFSGAGTFISVGIIDMYQAIIIFACGVPISFLILLAELYVSRKIKFPSATYLQQKHKPRFAAK